MKNQTIYQILRASLLTNEDVKIDDWHSVFWELQEQSVAALPGRWLKDHPIPGAEQWSSFCALQQGHWVRIMFGQRQLLELLENHRIHCVIIKGSAAAIAYPHPTFRAMGDVDFLVKREDYEKTAALLEDNGYHLVHKKNPARHHYAYSKDGIIYELHKRLAIVQEEDERLLSMFESGIDNRKYASIERFTFPILPEELNGLVLLFHINQHIRVGLGLRQIIDWMMYINNLSEEVWKDLVLPVLRDTEMEQLALTVTAMCQKYLGLKKIVEESETYPCDELMEYIMEKGNFGKKAGINGKIASFALSTENTTRLFKRFQAKGMTEWKAAQKYVLLKPFAWIYQIYRITTLFIKQGIGPKQIVQQHRIGIKQRELIEALGLKIDREIQ